MPQIATALLSWGRTVTLFKVTQTNTDGLVTDDLVQYSFRGVIQPLSPKELELKPEGQRAWEWLQIHAVSSCLNLQPNDKIQYNNKFYKVMLQNDYSLNGYVEYHLVYDYQG